MGSHKVEAIKDRIDDISKQNKKILRDMANLSEDEVKEVSDYLANSVTAVFSEEDLNKALIISSSSSAITEEEEKEREKNE